MKGLPTRLYAVSDHPWVASIDSKTNCKVFASPSVAAGRSASLQGIGCVVEGGQGHERRTQRGDDAMPVVVLAKGPASVFQHLKIINTCCEQCQLPNAIDSLQL